MYYSVLRKAAAPEQCDLKKTQCPPVPEFQLSLLFLEDVKLFYFPIFSYRTLGTIIKYTYFLEGITH